MYLPYEQHSQNDRSWIIRCSVNNNKTIYYNIDSGLIYFDLSVTDCIPYDSSFGKRIFLQSKPNE